MSSGMIFGMTQPQPFNMLHALRLADKAIAAGNTAVQRGKRKPKYIYLDGTRCIVGEMMRGYIAPTSLFACNGTVTRYLADRGYLTASSSEMLDLRTLQMSHDDACLGGSTLGDFLRVYRYVRAKYEQQLRSLAA
jgi:hypothetical protein